MSPSVFKRQTDSENDTRSLQHERSWIRLFQDQSALRVLHRANTTKLTKATVIILVLSLSADFARAAFDGNTETSQPPLHSVKAFHIQSETANAAVSGNDNGDDIVTPQVNTTEKPPVNLHKPEPVEQSKQNSNTSATGFRKDLEVFNSEEPFNYSHTVRRSDSRSTTADKLSLSQQKMSNTKHRKTKKKGKHLAEVGDLVVVRVSGHGGYFHVAAGRVRYAGGFEGYLTTKGKRKRYYGIELLKEYPYGKHNGDGDDGSQNYFECKKKGEDGKYYGIYLTKAAIIDNLGKSKLAVAKDMTEQTKKVGTHQFKKLHRNLKEFPQSHFSRNVEEFTTMSETEQAEAIKKHILE